MYSQAGGLTGEGEADEGQGAGQRRLQRYILNKVWKDK